MFEIPTIALERKNGNMLAALILLLLLLILSVINVTRVIKTGDYNSMILHDPDHAYRNIKLYYLQIFNIIFFPFFVPQLKTQGSFYFYKNRVEFAPWYKFGLGKRKIIPCDRMHVFVKYLKNSTCIGSITITNDSAQDCTNFLYKFRNFNWDSMCMALDPPPSETDKMNGWMSHRWKNPADIPGAIEFLRKNAASFNENL